MLTRETVERQIREMWDAITKSRWNDPDGAKAAQEAYATESRLRGELARQERLHAAAEEMLAFIVEMAKFLRAPHTWRDVLGKAEEADSIITKIEGQS